MTISKPRPCAKCGMDARIVYLGLNYGHVECVQCPRRSPDGQIDESIGEWNRKDERMTDDENGIKIPDTSDQIPVREDD